MSVNKSSEKQLHHGLYKTCYSILTFTTAALNNHSSAPAFLKARSVTICVENLNVIPRWRQLIHAWIASNTIVASPPYETAGYNAVVPEITQI
jgi:hypothetical protein